MAATSNQETQAMAATPARHTRRALSSARGQLQRRVLKLLGWLAFAFLLVKLVPSLKQALVSLEHVTWEWVLAAVALEVLSEFGFVISWRSIVDADNVLGKNRRDVRISVHAAWVQLGGGMIVPGGSLSSVGVGAWILHKFGMAPGTIAERQFNLSFLNTAIDAFALIIVGIGLATGLVPGERNLLLTLLPALTAAAGVILVLVVARRATIFSERVEARHPKLATAISTVSSAVDETARIVLHGEHRESLAGAVGYLLFDVLVLWTAFVALGAHPVPGFAVVVMAYIIGALGGSLPLPAGIGSVGGIAGMLIVYGVARNPAIAAVLLYEAVGLLVPLVGGAIAYLFLRREFGPMQTVTEAT